MSNTPFSITIFVANGDPDGLRLVERTNWVGKALIFPRTLLPSIKQREEFNQTGIYLLLGPREEDDGEMLYIGEGDPVRQRFESHYAKKDFWNRAVFFVAGSGQLNKAHVQFLESQLIARAKASKRYVLDNMNQPTEATLSESERAYMQVFLDNMLGMLPVLGIHAFEQVTTAIAPNRREFICRAPANNLIGHAYESTQGFVVKAGSQAAYKAAPSMHTHWSFNLRAGLIESGVLIDKQDYYVFAQDYVFDSPSAAAAMILGRSSNGRTEWKTADGTTLKTLQEREVPSTT